MGVEPFAVWRDLGLFFVVRTRIPFQRPIGGCAVPFGSLLEGSRGGSGNNFGIIHGTLQVISVHLRFLKDVLSEMLIFDILADASRETK